MADDGPIAAEQELGRQRGNKQGCKPPKLYCSECSKVFRCPDLLAAHEKETGHSAPKCDICGQTFPGWVELRQHQSNGHDKDGKPLPPTEVKTPAASLGAPAPKIEIVKQPSKAPTTSSPLAGYKFRPFCGVCNAGYNSAEALKDHQKHTRHKNCCYYCAVCKKKFEKPENLWQHIKGTGHEDQTFTPEQLQPKPQNQPRTAQSELPTRTAVAHQRESSRKDAKPSPGGPPTLVDSLGSLQEAQKVLVGQDTLAFDLEAVCCQHPRHHGPLSLLQFGLSGGKVYLIDVITLGFDAVRTHLGDPVLGNPNITKLMYDCRTDSETLSAQAGITPRGIVDLQVYVAYQRLNSTNRPGRRVGLFSALRDYLKLKDAKKVSSVTQRMRAGEKVWDERPLTRALLEYASGDVVYMHSLFKELQKRNPKYLQPTIRLSAKYVSLYAVGKLVNLNENAQLVNVKWMNQCMNEPKPGDATAAKSEAGSSEAEPVALADNAEPGEGDEEEEEEEEEAAAEECKDREEAGDVIGVGLLGSFKKRIFG